MFVFGVEERRGMPGMVVSGLDAGRRHRRIGRAPLKKKEKKKGGEGKGKYNFKRFYDDY